MSFSPFVPDRRQRVRRARPGLAALLALLAVVVAAAPALAQSATPAPAPTPDPIDLALESAVAYLTQQQGDDGGFAGLGGGSDPGTTADAVSALKAAEFRGLLVEPAFGEAIVYLEDQAADYAATGPAQAAKLALAVIAAGQDPTAFGGVDLLAAMTTTASAAADASPAASPVATPSLPGLYGDDLYDHALVLLALAAAGEPVPPAAIDLLRATQGEGGGWSFAGGSDPAAADSNTTALIVQALVATGNGLDPMVPAALEYLRSVQTILGQFAFQAPADGGALVGDANSTALAVQAIIATGRDPSSADDWANAARGLAAFQNASGAFRYQDTAPGDNLLATVQAIPALAGFAFPVAFACAEDAPEADLDETPVIALPAPGRGPAVCVAIDREAA